MSYATGLKFNDLNWDYISPFAKEKSSTCKHDDVVADCDSNTLLYGSRGWSITKQCDKFVSVNGVLPIKAYTSEHLKKWIMDVDVSPRRIKRVWAELLSRRVDDQPYQVMDVIAVWGISNSASLNVYSIDDYSETLLAGINNFEPRWYSIKQEFDGEDNSRAYINAGGKYYLDECMRVR